MFDFNEFYLGAFSTHDPGTYWDQYPGGKKLYKTNILALLKTIIAEQDVEGLSHALTIAYKDGVDKDYTDILVYLLGESWHTEEENIVGLLEEAADPKSIDILYNTAINIPDYDEMRALAKKCIWALWAIDTPEAIERIGFLKKSDDYIIREAATTALSKRPL